MASPFKPSAWSDFFLKYEPQPPNRMAGTGFSTTGKSIKSSRSHSDSTLAVSKAVSSASIVDLVNMVCLHDLHDTAPPPKKSEEWMKTRILKLKEDVDIYFKSCVNGLEKMNLVDAVKRLGIEHLFVVPISTALCDLHRSDFISSSLHEVALRFRLLREHGLWVSPDVFKMFKAEDGTFSEDVTNKPKELLCLYNAAYTLTHGEPELEEIISFARHHLESLVPSLSTPLVEQVKRSLHIPLPRTYKRLEALRYMPEYEQEEGHNAILLELAKLEFNLLQRVHLKELKDISEWWNDLSHDIELSFVRDRVVECYLWGYSVFYEEECALVRMIFAKLTMVHTLLDDINDVSATLEEYRMLDAAIQRWDESAVSLVPEYLKKFYNKLLSCFKKFEDELILNERYSFAHIKATFQAQSRYNLEEAEWLHQNHKPSFKDKLHLSAMSTGVTALCVYTMVCMGEAMPKGALEWALGCPDVVMACAKIGRLLNDLAGSAEKRDNKGDVANCVECYMDENKVTDEVAFAAIDAMVEDEWKTTHQARLQHHDMLPAVQRVVNFTLSLPVYYGDRKDAFTFSKHLDEIIKSLFVKPIPIY